MCVKALDEILTAAQEIPREKLPELLGTLEQIRLIAFARFNAPAEETRPDEVLTVDEAALRMRVSKSYLYQHHARLTFARKEGSRLFFSSSGLEKYLAEKSQTGEKQNER